MWLDSAGQSEWGIAFEIGGSVRWATTAFNFEWYAALLGDEPAARTPWQRWEDPDEADSEMAGTIKSIQALIADHERRRASWSGPPGGVWEPVPGSGHLRNVHRVGRREAHELGEPARSVMGWLVEIEHGNAEM